MATETSASFNHRYFIDHAARAGGRVLDYGCGVGAAVALGLARGIDIWGVDSFGADPGSWSVAILPAAQDRVRQIAADGVPFPDKSFDVIFCNQVLEHVADPVRFLAEAGRLLRPGGLFLASFPVWETWYEGHIGLYFGHRLAAWPKLRRAYFGLAHRLGLGFAREGRTRREWVAGYGEALDRHCFYRRRAALLGLIETALGARAEDWAADYMRARLGSRASRVPRVADPALRLICRLRAGEVIAVRR